MKSKNLAAAMLLISSSAALAAQPSAQDVMQAAQQLAQARHDAYSTKDAAAIGRQFDDNGVFVLLYPTLTVEQGPQGVEDYFHRLLARNVTDVQLHFSEAKVLPDGNGMVWGSYDISGAGKTVQGHIFEGTETGWW